MRDLTGGDFITVSSKFNENIAFLEDLKKQPQLLGGDPSVISNFQYLRDQSFSAVKKTGYSEIKDLDSFYSINNQKHNLAFKKYFDGKSVITKSFNPWPQ